MTRQERKKQLKRRWFWFAWIIFCIICWIPFLCKTIKAQANEIDGLTAGAMQQFMEISMEPAIVEEETEVVEEAAPVQPYSDNDLDLLARLIYAEAGACKDDLTLAYVGSVVINRMASDRYPNTISGVIYDEGQYAPTWTGTINKWPDERSYQIATEVLDMYYETGETYLPSNVYGQAGFVLNGWSCYCYSEGIYFSYPNK